MGLYPDHVSTSRNKPVSLYSKSKPNGPKTLLAIDWCAVAAQLKNDVEDIHVEIRSYLKLDVNVPYAEVLKRYLEHLFGETPEVETVKLNHVAFSADINRQGHRVVLIAIDLANDKFALNVRLHPYFFAELSLTLEPAGSLRQVRSAIEDAMTKAAEPAEREKIFGAEIERPTPRNSSAKDADRRKASQEALQNYFAGLPTAKIAHEELVRLALKFLVDNSKAKHTSIAQSSVVDGLVHTLPDRFSSKVEAIRWVDASINKRLVFLETHDVAGTNKSFSFLRLDEG